MGEPGMTRRLWCCVVGALIVLSAPAFAAASVAAASVAASARASGDEGGRYDGHTTQGGAISFRVSGGYLRGLQFVIDVVCPSRRVWKVTTAVAAPVRIVNSRFAQSFSSRRRGAQGTATIRGQLERNRITGTLTMKRYIAPEHHYCAGSAGFALNRAGAPPGRRTGHRNGSPPPAFTAA